MGNKVSRIVKIHGGPIDQNRANLSFLLLTVIVSIVWMRKWQIKFTNTNFVREDGLVLQKYGNSTPSNCLSYASKE